MIAEKINKKQIITDWTGDANNTGSTKAQIGLLTARVKMISEHVLKNHKDHSSRRGLLKIIGQRKRLIKYLARQDSQKAKEVQVKIKL